MTRFTSIGMPKKSFVPSAAEETREKHDGNDAPAAVAANEATGEPPAKKRKRRGTRGRVEGEGEAAQKEAPKGKGGWGRDPDVAKRAKMSAEHAFQRREKRKDERSSSTTCFACRSVGHAARECPNVLLALEKTGEGSATLLGEGETGEKAQGMKRKKGKKGGDVVGGNCYRCNGTDHSLKDCPTPLNPTNPHPFATCFICLGTGHLSSLCPSNPGRGIYVNGGSCKVCNSTAHRAKDCPEEAKQRRDEAREARPRRGEIVLGTGGAGAGADEDDFMVQSREHLKEAGMDGASKGKKKKHPPANNGQRGKMADYDTTSSVPKEAAEPVKEVKKVSKSKAKTVSF